MANMSYCGFENTYVDFKDCVSALQEGLSDLSDSERHYAEKLYELAKTYVGLYEMELQSSEEESNDNPTIEQEKCWFLQYYKVQMKGDYNMICDSENAAKAAGLTPETYFYIQANYNTFRNMFSTECEVIEKQIMEELHHES